MEKINAHLQSCLALVSPTPGDAGSGATACLYCVLGILCFVHSVSKLEGLGLDSALGGLSTPKFLLLAVV